MNYPAANSEVSTGKDLSKDEASFGELNPHWGIKTDVPFFSQRNI